MLEVASGDYFIAVDSGYLAELIKTAVRLVIKERIADPEFFPL